MKVRMKEDKQGSPDGINVIDYKKGKVYDMPDELAKPWIKKGLAVAVKPPKVEEEIEEPKAEEPDETKVIEPPETKEEAPEENNEEIPPEEKVEKPPEPEKKKKK